MRLPIQLVVRNAFERLPRAGPFLVELGQHRFCNAHGNLHVEMMNELALSYKVEQGRQASDSRNEREGDSTHYSRGRAASKIAARWHLPRRGRSSRLLRQPHRVALATHRASAGHR